MSYNITIKTYIVQFAKNAATIGFAALVLAVWYGEFINILAYSSPIDAVIAALPFGLFFAGASYIPVYIIHDYLDIGADTLKQRVALLASTVIASGAAVWLVIFGLVGAEYVLTGPQPHTLSARQMFTSIVAFFVVIGMMSCCLFGIVRFSFAIVENRSIRREPSG